jgi:D-alanyl-lipoteichoic acid acyltransferase DltB (MBOAT superfamily)
LLFHTPTFLVFFLAFAAVYFSTPPGRGRVYVLLVFSNIFYGWWDWRFLGLLWVTKIVDYGLSVQIARTDDARRRKRLLAGSVVTNLGILAFFKYWNFLIDSVLALHVDVSALRVHDLVLPVGISFYVFQSMSYAIDVYRRRIAPAGSLVEFAAFVSYFPQLVAGPIERAGNLLPQILRPARPTASAIASGMFLFASGFLRKALGDVLAGLVDPVLSDVAGAPPGAVVLAVLGFGGQIYLDFSGYSEMARGMARAMGVELMANFSSPYLATSFRDFWHRWHISLSEWLRDYLYVPLGGNRHGRGRTLRNLMITMLLGGLWHGAGWNFVIWGFLHGLYLILNVLWDQRMPAPRTAVTRVLSAAGGWIVTLLGVQYAWIYFRMGTFQEAVLVNRKIVEWLAHPSLPVTSWTLLAALATVFVVDLVQRDRGPVLSSPEATPLRDLAFGAVAGCFLLLGVILLAGQPTHQFLYFQF